MAVKPVTVAETALFSRQAADIWNAAEHDAFVDFIALNPEAGDIVPDAGGVRKVRWRRAGTGKRGGVRVIYFYYDPEYPLFLMMLYAKSEREDISTEDRKTFRRMATELKYAGRNRPNRRWT